jgi:hypothetical protein
MAGSAAPVFAIATIGGSAAESAASARLDTAKLKVCKIREKVIDNTLTRIADRGSRHLALITDVATKTEAFYAKSGKTLSNYDTLVAAVNSDQAAAQTAANLVKSDSTSFSCDGTDPTGVVQTFRDDVKAEVTALQTYRTAVKDLLAGVKSNE